MFVHDATCLVFATRSAWLVHRLPTVDLGLTFRRCSPHRSGTTSGISHHSAQFALVRLHRVQSQTPSRTVLPASVPTSSNEGPGPHAPLRWAIRTGHGRDAQRPKRATVRAALDSCGMNARLSYVHSERLDKAGQTQPIQHCIKRTWQKQLLAFRLECPGHVLPSPRPSAIWPRRQLRLPLPRPTRRKYSGVRRRRFNSAGMQRAGGLYCAVICPPTPLSCCSLGSLVAEYSAVMTCPAVQE